MKAVLRKLALFVGVSVGVWVLIGVGAGVSVAVLDAFLEAPIHSNPSLERKFIDGAGLGLIVSWPGSLIVGGIAVGVAHRTQSS